MLDGDYTQLWVIWLALFGVIEGAAVFNKKSGDTLSEHVWKIIGSKAKGYPLPSGYKWRRAALGGFFGWLILHFFTGSV